MSKRIDANTEEINGIGTEIRHLRNKQMYAVMTVLFVALSVLILLTQG